MAHNPDYEDEYLTDPGTEEESEDESLFDEGPGDGYFQQREHPQTQFVEDSAVTARAESKAREAASSSSAAGAATSHFSSVASSPRNTTWTMAAADHNPEAPPPTYESATTASSQAHSNQNGSIHTQNASYLAGPGSGGQPQSMRDPAPPSVDEESGLLGSSKSYRYSTWRQRLLNCFKPLSICNIILIAAIVVVISLVAGVVSDDYTKGGGSGGEWQGNNPISPPISPTPSQSPSIPTHKGCDLSTTANTLQLNFDNLNNFTFLELMESSAYFAGGIKGQITIQPASVRQDSDIRVSISYATSAPWQIQHSDYIQTHDSLTLQLPSVVKVGDGNGYASPCLGVSVRIEIRPGLQLDNWELVTGNFDVQIADNLFPHSSKRGSSSSSAFHIKSTSSFSAIHGKISASYWSSRRTIIETSSGSITGLFALRDLLVLHSQSGSVNVRVDPKEADPDAVRPAEFVVHTSSGSVEAYFPDWFFSNPSSSSSSLEAGEESGEIPIRDYRTRIETSSASIKGRLILGMQTSLHTQSGHLDVELLPVIISSSSSDSHDHEYGILAAESAEDALISHLQATTSSASQTISILEPHHLPNNQNFASIHTEQKFTSSSGSLHLTYPDSWEGYIEGSTSSGSIEIRGRGVEFLSGRDDGGEKKKSGWWGRMYRFVVARKGDGSGKGRVKFGTGSASVGMQMGGD